MELATRMAEPEVCRTATNTPDGVIIVKAGQIHTGGWTQPGGF